MIFDGGGHGAGSVCRLESEGACGEDVGVHTVNERGGGVDLVDVLRGEADEGIDVSGGFGVGQIKGAGIVFYDVVVVTAHRGELFVAAKGRPDDGEQLVGVLVGGGGGVAAVFIVHIRAGRLVFVVCRRVSIAGDLAVISRHTARDAKEEHQGCQ